MKLFKSFFLIGLITQSIYLVTKGTFVLKLLFSSTSSIEKTIFLFIYLYFVVMLISIILISIVYLYIFITKKPTKGISLVIRALIVTSFPFGVVLQSFINERTRSS